MTELYAGGKSYSSLNTARSALSVVMVNKSGLTIGNSPLVKRFMKGVFELKPPTSRYGFIWDVSVVLDFLQNYYPNRDLSLCVLTYKCVMLLALSSLQRVQTLLAIDITNIEFFDNMLIIPIKKKLKQFRVGKDSFSICLEKFSEQPAICPYLVLREYLQRTRLLRSNTTQLFISHYKPYFAITASTISRWIKIVLYEAGIDTNYFKAHSTRAAGASAARASDMPIEEIMKRAGWCNANTFKRFYDKVII